MSAGIVDYPCGYNDRPEIDASVLEELGLSYPEALKRAESMAAIAKAISKRNGAYFAALPFCHTVEGEAMGGAVNFGDPESGPRAGEYRCRTLEDALSLPEIDFNAGRISETLKACRICHDDGIAVALKICGPFTTLNMLLDLSVFFRGARKNPDLVRAIYAKIQQELLRYAEKAVDAGVTIISYADPAGSVKILGPRMAESVARDFTYGFLEELAKITGNKAVIALCPKTTFALIGTDLVTRRDVAMPESVSCYQEACAALAGKVGIVGQTCIKDSHFAPSDRIIKEFQLRRKDKND